MNIQLSDLHAVHLYTAWAAACSKRLTASAHDAPFSHLNCWNCKPKYLRISLQKWYKHEASPLHEHGPVASWVGGALRIAPRVTTSGETFKSWLQHGSCQPMSTNVNNEPKTESDWIYSVFGSCHFDSPEHICPELLGLKGMQLGLLNKWHFGISPVKSSESHIVDHSRTIYFVKLWVCRPPKRWPSFLWKGEAICSFDDPASPTQAQPLCTFCSERHVWGLSIGLQL